MFNGNCGCKKMTFSAFLWFLLIEVVHSQTTQNINVSKYLLTVLLVFFYCNFVFFSVYVNEEGNTVADKAIDVAMNYIKKTSKLGLSVEMKRVVGNRSDSQNILDSRNYIITLT